MTKAFRAAKYLANVAGAELRAALAADGFPKPAHIGRSLIASWPALSSWTLQDGLQRLRDGIGENREVDVELGPRGRGYLHPEHARVSIGLGLFLDAFMLNRIPSSGGSGTTGGLPIGYLAQSDLPASLVRSDVSDLPHYTCGPRQEIYRRTLWVGPTGSFTPFHRDPYIGIYSQIVGRKRFYILPPHSARLLDLCPHPPHQNTSQIPMPVTSLMVGNDRGSEAERSPDIPPKDQERYRSALTEAAAEMNGSCVVDLEPGESVLVPEGWFHSAEGLSPGVGVNAWFR